MRHIIKKMICLCLVTAFLLSASGIKAYAIEPWPGDCYVVADGACLMDADSGTVLFSQNAEEAYYPASITKVLTALVVLENCSNLNEQVTFSYDAVHLNEDNATIIGASEGDRLSVLDCLYSLLFQSANEVANALAEHVGAMHPELKESGMNDRDVFVRMMNEKAASLGCKGSNFNNPSGLTDSNHYTTAYDMCLIMKAAIENDQFLDIERRTYWTHAPIIRYPDADDPWNTVYPKHLMMKRNSSQYYEGTIAGKTGYTLTAGNTLVTACERNGMRLVSCVLNGHSTHYSDTRRLMDFGFDNFISLTVSEYDDINSTIQRDFSLGGVALIDAYTFGIDSGTKVCIPKAGSYVEIEKELEVGGENGNPSSAKVIYRYGDRIVGSSELKLIRIDDIAAAKATAGDDPMLMSILGMSEEAETDSTVNDSTAADSAAAGSAGAGSAADGSAEVDSAADGSDEADSAGVSKSNGNVDLAEGDLSGNIVSSKAGEPSFDETQPEVWTHESDTASAEEPKDEKAGFNVKRILIYGCIALIVIISSAMYIRLLRDRRAAKRRAEHKAIREGIRARSEDRSEDDLRIRLRGGDVWNDYQGMSQYRDAADFGSGRNPSGNRRYGTGGRRKVQDSSIGRQEASQGIGDIGRKNLINSAGGGSGVSGSRRYDK